MTTLRKSISFEEFKACCGDKFFEQRSEFGYFIKCKLGPPFCNERVCIPWNKLEDVPKPLLSLREINQQLSERDAK